MARNPVPGLVMSSPYDDTKYAQNNQSVITWAQTVSPRMLSLASPLSGSNPPTPPSDAFLDGAGTIVVETNSAGLFTYDFDPPYPNGLMTLTAVVGDTTPANFMGVTLKQPDCTNTGFGGYVWYWTGSAIAAVASQNVRINYRALGW